eukprot:SAG11_NODE_14992_length_592_cov_0.795132_1_plen_130_part_10
MAPKPAAPIKPGPMSSLCAPPRPAPPQRPARKLPPGRGGPQVHARHRGRQTVLLERHLGEAGAPPPTRAGSPCAGFCRRAPCAGFSSRFAPASRLLVPAGGLKLRRRSAPQGDSAMPVTNYPSDIDATRP